MDIGDATFDQIKVFLEAVRGGSFSAAARAMNRTQPAVTYTIEKLEAQLGICLFDRSGYRPRLTSAGLALLPRAKVVAAGMASLVEQARSLRAGVETEVWLTVDSMFPMDKLLPIVDAFRHEWPTVGLSIMVEHLGASVDNVRQNSASIGLLAAPVLAGEDLVRTSVVTVELIAVAASVHPLALKGERLSREDLGRHAQIVLTDRKRAVEARDYGIVSPLIWRTSDLGAKHAMILAGLGWGGLPEHTVRADLADRRLTRLPLAEGNGARAMVFDLVWSPDAHLGPATAWLADALGGLA